MVKTENETSQGVANSKAFLNAALAMNDSAGICSGEMVRVIEILQRQHQAKEPKCPKTKLPNAYRRAILLGCQAN
jgi:hypothetical protein